MQTWKEGKAGRKNHEDNDNVLCKDGLKLVTRTVFGICRAN